MASVGGLGGAIMRETQATGWALRLAEDFGCTSTQVSLELGQAIDRHAAFLHEIPAAVRSPKSVL